MVQSRDSAKDLQGPHARSAERIVAAAEQLTQARAELDAAVRAARSEGATWSQVGAVLGITRQAAWERFHGRRPQALRAD